MWWGIIACSSLVGFAVPMFIRLYICIESRDTISKSRTFSAMVIPNFDLPEAVVPTIANRGFRIDSLTLLPQECEFLSWAFQLFQVSFP